MNVLISRRVKYTGKIFEPGTILDLPEDKAWRLINQCWAEPIQYYESAEPEFSDSSRLFSNGKPTFATLTSPPHVRVFAWCLANLGFGPDLAGRPTDCSLAGKECRLSLPEVREAFGKLLAEGDLKVERTRRGDLWYLTPVRW